MIRAISFGDSCRTFRFSLAHDRRSSERLPVKLPHADQAIISAPSIRDDLQSEAHPVGRFKATFFATLGYSAGNWQQLLTALARHASEHEAQATETTEYGQKYEVHGRLTGPAGKSAMVVSVWIVLAADNSTRFVTAFPGAKS